MVAPPFVAAAAYGIFDRQLREAIHALKFNNARVLARPLGGYLAHAIERLMLDAPPEMLVVPVPLHQRKERQRGFNQARVLAAAALAELGHSHPEWQLTLASRTLIRHKETAPQSGLTPRERRINLKQAFQVGEPDALTGRDVLLIDDIMTTGATARAAATVLLGAGAKSVRVATVARAILSNGNSFQGSATVSGTAKTKHVRGIL
jgi:ComF family protein